MKFKQDTNSHHQIKPYGASMNILDTKNVTVNDLLNAKKSDLKKLFVKCESFKIEELDGQTNGTVINGNLLWNNKLGLFLTNLIWKGKVFMPNEKNGLNLLSIASYKFSHFKFKTNIEKSNYYTGDVFTLRYKYQFSLNPFPIRIIVDEMRKIRDGLFLGTGNLNLMGKFFLFDWYILENEERK